MRLLLIGIMCLFCGAAFADGAANTQQQVPNVAYVNSRVDTIAIGKPAETAPDGRALVWIEM